MSRRLLPLLSTVLVVALAVTGAPARAQDGPVKLTDVFIEMDDGVRLASDVYLPPGTPTDGSVKVPCLVELTPYRKENRAAEAVAVLPSNGFGVIEVDARGTGGSEGEYDIVFSLREQYDTAAVIEWAATTSPWCTEKVGMFGGSYSGIIQYLVASLPEPHYPEHLVTIAPQRAYGDLYRDIVYHGGQVIGSFGAAWSTGTTAFYTQPPTNIDTPEGQSAWTDHLTQNDPMMLNYYANPYADDVFSWTNETGSHSQRLYADSSVLPRIGNLRVPTLHLAGLFDTFTRGQLLTFQQALKAERTLGDRGPHYLIAGPWNHGGTHFVTPARFTDRMIDWYRYWLADGAEPSWFGNDRALYYLIGEGALDDDTGEWRTSTSWPPDGIAPERLYLRAGGGLSTEPPGVEEGSSTYVYNPTAGTAEVGSRWDNAVAGVVPMPAWDQRTDGPKGLTFQTDPLATDAVVAGPISFTLHASTTGLDGNPDIASNWPGAAQLTPPYHDTDFVVKVSDVQPDGTALLITQGYLRASHRAVDPSRSWGIDGETLIPFHPHTLESIDPPPSGELRDYVIEIWPTAKTFRAGHSIRIDVYSADTPNHLALLKPALNTIAHEAGSASYLSLPLLPS